MAVEDGPSVLVAAFCEAILQEGPDDNNTLSAIRFLESVTAIAELGLPPGVTVEEAGPPPPIPIDLNLLIMLRGMPPGEHSVQVLAIRPDGTTTGEALETRIERGGPGMGANLKIQVRTLFAQSGLYYFEIGFDRKTLLTRIPLLVHVDQRLISQGETLDEPTTDSAPETDSSETT